MTNFEALPGALTENNIHFVVTGGAVAIAHGSARSTLDLDIVYDRSPQNLERFIASLTPLRPYRRGAPEGLPFIWDRAVLERV